MPSQSSCLASINITTLVAICLPLIIGLLAINADPLTRGAGMVHYPPLGPALQPDYYYGRMNQSQGSVNKIRIALTRDTSFDRSGELREPQVSYYGAIGVGSPPKIFNVVFDTGVGEIWLPYYNWFPLANNLHYSDGYSCRDSSTCRSLDSKYTLSYRLTRLSGTTYQDVFTLYEDMQKEEAQVMVGRQASFAQNFLAVDDASDEQFRYKPYDGAIGLAPLAQSASGLQYILLSFQGEHERRTMQAAGSDLVPPAPYLNQYSDTYPPSNGGGPSGGYYNNNYQPPVELMFAFWFNPNKNSRYGGDLMLGGVDENRFLGEIFWHNINSWTEWSVWTPAVLLGNQVISCAYGCNAVLDTGANSLVGPRRDVEQIYAELQAEHHEEADMWTVDCNRLDQYPTLVFYVDNAQYKLGPHHYTRIFRYHEAAICSLMIKPWDRSNWLLGTSFIGSYYTVFDFKNRRVGFAMSRN